MISIAKSFDNDFDRWVFNNFKQFNDSSKVKKSFKKTILGFFSEEEIHWILGTYSKGLRSVRVIWLFLKSKNKMPFTYNAFASWCRKFCSFFGYKRKDFKEDAIISNIKTFQNQQDNLKNNKEPKQNEPVLDSPVISTIQKNSLKNEEKNDYFENDCISKNLKGKNEPVGFSMNPMGWTDEEFEKMIGMGEKREFKYPQGYNKKEPITDEMYQKMAEIVKTHVYYKNTRDRWDKPYHNPENPFCKTHFDKYVYNEFFLYVMDEKDRFDKETEELAKGKRPPAFSMDVGSDFNF